MSFSEGNSQNLDAALYYEALASSLKEHAEALRNHLGPEMPYTAAPPVKGAAEDGGSRPLSIEELCFSSAMSCFEGWLKLDPAIGPRTMAYVTKFITRTLEKTHNLKDVR